MSPVAQYYRAFYFMRILVADDLHPVFFEMLKGEDMRIDYHPDITREMILEVIPVYDMLVLRSKVFVDEEILDAATKLRCIARAGSGLDNINEDACAKRNITLINVPEANANAVAEHALALLLNLLRNVHKSGEEIKNGIWLREENRGVELSSLKIGIIGYGHTGTAFTEKLLALGASLWVYDKYKKDFGKERLKEVSLEELQSTADVISFHVPLTTETKYYFSKEFIAACAHPFFLLNTSRGKVVSLEALLEGLNNGHVRGAALDVLENERLSQFSEKEKQILSNLLSFSSVLLTSHIAGWTVESYRKIAERLAIKIAAFKSI